MATKKAPTKKIDAEPNGQPETPEARFQRLAQARVSAALKRIALIGNLGGPGYKSTEEQRKKIGDALQNAVDTVNAKLSKEKATGQVFTL